MVECTALEMRHTGNRIEGSNPSLSARHLVFPHPPKPTRRKLPVKSLRNVLQFDDITDIQQFGTPS